MAEDDDDQKTEDPSQKKLDEAREKGNVANSREVGSFLLISLLAFLAANSGPLMRDTKELIVPFLGSAHMIPTDMGALGQVLTALVLGSLAILSLPLLATFVAALASGFLQRGVMFSLEPIIPKLSKISPMAGFGRIFSMRNLVEFLKSLIKISIAAAAAYFAIAPQIGHVKQLPDSTTEALLAFIEQVSVQIIIWVAIALFFIAGLDFFYQKMEHLKKLRMSKQELKDEYKQSEGDPMIKMRLRQIRAERARNRMMSAVPTSDVVITNPTHFAVALKYERGVMTAPTVVAKGQDLIALRIRDVAEEHDIPVIEDPPLARALFASSEINEQIPTQHYEAVAKIISYVYKLKGKSFGR